MPDQLVSSGTCSDDLRQYIEAIIEEVVIEGKPFDRQKKYLQRFCNSEELDYALLNKNLTSFFETMSEIGSCSKAVISKLVPPLCRECFLGDVEINRFIRAFDKHREGPPQTRSFQIDGLYNTCTFKMIRVNGGDFEMGNNFEKTLSFLCEAKPAHQVKLSTYMIGETLVTESLWNAVMAEGPMDLEDANFPKVNISWLDCKQFIEKLNSLTGESFRLPSEAEWEFAARGGTESKGHQYSGSDKISKVGWASSRGNLPRVALKAPNELGIYDMSGLVYEWCEDHYVRYSKQPQTDPVFYSENLDGNRVIRGGSYSDLSSASKVYSRTSAKSTDSNRFIGMRLAL